MTKCFLSDDKIRKLNRDLRILIATNGTLTRILSVIADDEIVVQIIKQQIHHLAPKITELEHLASGRILERRVLLKGRSSGKPFVIAESWIAIDRLPPAIMTSLTTTDRPIGEVMETSRLETFKEAAEVWIDELPDWLPVEGYRDSRRRTVGRRYRIICGGQPVLIITEYFLRTVFQHTAREELDRCQHSNGIDARSGDSFELINRIARSP